MERPVIGYLGDLADAGRPLRAGLLMRLSDAGADVLRELRLLWPDIPVDRRRKIVRRMVDIAEDDVEADFRSALRVFLKDADPEVRAVALEGLWEDETPSLADQITEMLAGDPVAMVRAAAAEALSNFATAAALGELKGGRGPALRRALLQAYRRPGEEQSVRCQALRSLAFFDDDEVAELIAEAYQSADVELRAGAVCAMGENLDPKWGKTVKMELSSPHPAIRFEAATAAGLMELKEAVSDLVELTADGDTEVRLAAIGALGQIGGPTAKRTLTTLAKSEKQAIREAAESALDELSFMQSPLGVPDGGIPALPKAKPDRGTKAGA